MFFGGRKELEDPEYKNLVNTSNPKDAPIMKPSDVRNGDLVSLLLAANPPYLYNMPLVPQTFFFSEMLRSFVQAKTERQSSKSHQVHTRRRKRTWRETTSNPDPDKPLELTTPKTPPEEKDNNMQPKKASSCNFTAEKLANSSVNSSAADVGPPSGDMPPVAPPVWYHPTLYPNQPIDPLHFFIDLRVSAHIWDRKIINDGEKSSTTLPTLPSANEQPIKLRHCSAFSAPKPKTPEDSDGIISTGETKSKGNLNIHHIMSNLKEYYVKPAEKSRDDIRALIGLELVSDFVKQESDVSDEETHFD